MITWLSGILKLAGLGPLKWLNPVWGVIVTAFQWLAWATKKFVEGVLSFLTNPVETFAVVCLCLVSLAIGLKWGIAWDAHKVEAAYAQLAAVEEQMKGKDDADAARAKAAIKARAEAESAADEQIKMEASKEPVAVHASAASAAKPRRVRSKYKVRRRQQKSGLQSFQDDFSNLIGYPWN